MHAVEATVAEIAGQRGQPRAAQHAARIPHRVLSPGPGPVGQRRAGQQDRPHQVGGDRAQHHHGPAGLAVADDARPAVGFGMELGDLLQEEALGPADILEGLSGHGLRPEADEVARVAGTQGHADLAVHLGAADPGTVAGARIEDDERALARIRPRAGRRDDSYQVVVDGPPERPTVEHHLVLEGQDRRLALRLVLEEHVAALAHHVAEQDGALGGVDPVIPGRLPRRARRRPVPPPIGPQLRLGALLCHHDDPPRRPSFHRNARRVSGPWS